MKPFDLEKALAGEPVKLRKGLKAFVKYKMEEKFLDKVEEYVLHGFILNNGVCDSLGSWTINGKFVDNVIEDRRDIIGMWEEPRPRVQLDLPCPLKTAEIGQTVYYQIGKEVCSSKFGYDSFVDRILELGCVFDTKEDCQEWIDAIRQSKR